MKFSFRAKIYKVGINPCVKVPFTITKKMIPSKGYIPVKGKIENHNFKQTLVPVKNAEYRLYVNGPMLKGANVKVGQTVNFTIAQNFTSRKREVPIHSGFKKALASHNLTAVFKALTPSRQKEILKYLNYLKTEEAILRNIAKVIGQLKRKAVSNIHEEVIIQT